MDEREDAALGLTALVLQVLSPAEVPLVDIVGPALLAGPPARDGSLGFGVQDLTWLVAAVPVTQVAVDVLMDMARGVAVDQVNKAASGWIARLRGIRHQDQPVITPPPLPVEVLTRVHQETYRHALAVGLEEPRARLMADAVAGTLTARA